MQKAIAGFVACIMLVSGPIAAAQEQTAQTLTDDQISLTKSNCRVTQTALQRIHEADALARFRLGQQYVLISKLMAPMNSRLSLNHIDSVDTVQTAVEFDKRRDEFTSLYIQYEETMSRALAIDCTNQPVSFYDTITLAREHRAAVRAVVERLNELAVQYKTQLDTKMSARKAAN